MSDKRAMYNLVGTLEDHGQSLDGTLSGPALRGYSAYTIAVLHGYTGTEEEWLESLNGKQIELRNNNGVLEWRYQGDEQWQPLIDLYSLIDEAIEDAVTEDVDEALKNADLYDLVDELPEDPKGNHIYVLREDEGDGE